MYPWEHPQTDMIGSHCFRPFFFFYRSLTYPWEHQTDMIGSHRFRPLFFCCSLMYPWEHHQTDMIGSHCFPPSFFFIARSRIPGNILCSRVRKTAMLYAGNDGGPRSLCFVFFIITDDAGGAQCCFHEGTVPRSNYCFLCRCKYDVYASLSRATM